MKFNFFFKKSFSKIIKIDFSDLKKISDTKNYSSIKNEIKEAYGPNGLGALIVKDVPNHFQLKYNLLKLTKKLADLPKESLLSLEKPKLGYSIGWSHGKERFEDRVDERKGSYYGVLKVYNELKGLIENKSEDINVWPVKDLPELEISFMELGNQIRQVSFHLIRCIDYYIKSIYPSYTYKNDEIIKASDANKARLLHYFPRGNSVLNNGDWCGWHNDHGTITGLTSAMYFDSNNNLVNDNLKLEKTGLWAQTRSGDKVKVSYGQNDIAFQIGETYQILSGGTLIATPHAVIVDNDIPSDVHRSTYALFMQPKKTLKLEIPNGSTMKNIETSEIYTVPKLQKRFIKNGMTFEEFDKETIKEFLNY